MNEINLHIARLVSGEASRADIQELKKWLNENDENQKEFFHLLDYWYAHSVHNNTISLETSLNNLIDKINIENAQHNIRKPKRIKMYFYAAASVAVIVLISLVLHLIPDNVFSSEHYYTYLSGNARTEIMLDDSTIVVLEKNSTLQYTNEYGSNNRIVKLKGKAYFDVTRNEKLPFIIDFGTEKIKVLGTSFYVEGSDRSREISATLISGSIHFESTSQQVLLRPSQQLLFSRADSSIDIVSVDTERILAWKDGLLMYKSIPFGQLISELEKIYDVQIVIENASYLDPSVIVSGTFEQNYSIDHILRVISEGLPIHFIQKDGIYYIR